jgi:antirestriction protein ArdC
MTAADAKALADLGIQQLVGDEHEWQRWAETAAKFPTYSMGNAYLILAQRPDASQVAGFQTWQRLGRHVRAGEHGLTILAPLVRQAPDPERPEDPPRRVVTGFKAVSVFDVGQTDGRALAQPTAHELTGDTLRQLVQHLMAQHVVGSDITVALEDPGGGALGVWRPATRSIAVAPHLAPDQQAKTLLHEWAHSLGVPDALAAQVRHHGPEEVTAETSAYVVAQALGLDTRQYSRGYVAGWADLDPQAVTAVAGDVGRRVHTMIGALSALQARAPHPALDAAVTAWEGPSGWVRRSRTREVEAER